MFVENDMDKESGDDVDEAAGYVEVGPVVVDLDDVELSSLRLLMMSMLLV